MSNELRISIITVVLNGFETIEQTIKSVLEQDYPDIEYILIDGGSTDGTVDIIKKYKDSISYWVSEQDDGLYDAMNKGITKSTGDIIGILNADDWYEPGVLGEIEGYFAKDKELQVVAGQVRMLHDTGYVKCSSVESMESIWCFMPLKHPAMFVRKGVYEKYGNYDTLYKIAADYDLVFRLYINGVKIKIVENIWTNFRYGGVSTNRLEEATREAIRIKKKYIAEYGENVDKETFERSNMQQMAIAHLRQDLSDDRNEANMFLKRRFEDGISLYGYGDWGRILRDKLTELKIKIRGIYDADPVLWGKDEVEPPCMLKKQYGDLLITIENPSDNIIKSVINLCNENTRVVPLFKLAEEYNE